MSISCGVLGSFGEAAQVGLLGNPPEDLRDERRGKVGVFPHRAAIHHCYKEVAVGNISSDEGVFVVVGVVSTDLRVGQYSDG